MEKVMVSVVMISYAHENYIIQAIEGVLMQKSNFNIELIIANDNSPDNTDEQIIKYLALKIIPTNITVKYTNHKVNKGMMPNFMWGLKKAEGKYIALCEGDDYWTDPLKLQKQVDFLEDDISVSLSFHNRKILKRNNLFSSESLGKRDRKFTSNKIIEFCPTQTMVFRNYEDLSELNFSGVFSGDFFLKAFLSTKGDFHFHSFEGAVYREHDGGVATSKSLETSRQLFIESRIIALDRINDINQSEVYQSIFNLQTDLLSNGLKNKSLSYNVKLIRSMLYYAFKSRRLISNIRLMLILIIKKREI